MTSRSTLANWLRLTRYLDIIDKRLWKTTRRQARERPPPFCGRGPAAGAPARPAASRRLDERLGKKTDRIEHLWEQGREDPPSTDVRTGRSRARRSVATADGRAARPGPRSAPSTWRVLSSSLPGCTGPRRAICSWPLLAPWPVRQGAFKDIIRDIPRSRPSSLRRSSDLGLEAAQAGLDRS